MKSNDELNNLFAELNITGSAADDIRRDLQDGQDLLNQNEPPLPADLLNRISRQWQAPVRQTTWPLRFKRIAAVLILALGLAGLMQVTNKPSKDVSAATQTILVADGIDVLETALVLEQEELDLALDDVTINEILAMWDDAGWDIQQLFGKELSDETDTFTYRRSFNDWIV